MRPESPPTSAGCRVELADVRRTFADGTEAVGGVSLDVPAGQFVSLLGPSGCGKSTLLRIIAGLDRPTAGRVDLAPTPRVAYVFQDAHLLPWRSALRNVALPLELAGVAKAERLDRATSALAAVGLADAGRRYPAELSGGMRMRCSLARALVTDPDLLLLDEPFAALDEITRQSLDVQLRDLWRSRRMTVIFVTHSIAEAAYLAERVVVLSRQPARVVLDQTLDLSVDRPPELRTDPDFARQTRLLYDALVEGQRV